MKRILVLIVALAITYLLVGPINASASGTLGGAGTFRTQWGILSYLSVTSNVTMFDTGNLVQSRQMAWSLGATITTAAVLVGVWFVVLVVLRPRGRAALVIQEGVERAPGR
jgi:hypothetical protein